MPNLQAVHQSFLMATWKSIAPWPRACGKSRSFIQTRARHPLLLGLLAAGLLVTGAKAEPCVTLAQLRNDPLLTPERFTNYFADFEFKLCQTRQAPEVFLASRSGDCDDFACLAADVLREKKYTTKLIAVFMKEQTHVVCYVKEAGGYLDFNRRKECSVVQAAGGKLAEVAAAVAASFRTTWLYASEFTYHDNGPRFGEIVFR